MHETSIMEQVIREVENVAARNHLAKIIRFTLRVGTLSGVVPEALEFAFIGMRRGTILEDAEMKIELLPAIFRCDSCDKEFRMEAFEYSCPECGGLLTLVGGSAVLELVSVEGVPGELL